MTESYNKLFECLQKCYIYPWSFAVKPQKYYECLFDTYENPWSSKGQSIYLVCSKHNQTF